MAYQNFEFLKNFIANRSDPSLIAGIQKLPRSYPAGTGTNIIPAIDNSGGRLGNYRGLGRGDWQRMDDDFPNPFGGGSAPYMPGAMLNNNFNQNIASVPHPGPYPYGQPDKWDAWEKQYNAHEQDKLKMLQNEDLIGPPPNPFGGGGAAYVRGV